jgi:hypothetical protein
MVPLALPITDADGSPPRTRPDARNELFERTNPDLIVLWREPVT